MCEKCEAIREAILGAIADAASVEAMVGNPADFDAWLLNHPLAIEDLQTASIPYERAQAAWCHGYLAAKLLAELGPPANETEPVPNMPGADA